MADDPVKLATLSDNATDESLQRMAIEEAKKSIAEDERPRPKVGVIVVKDGVVLAKAHRGEIPKCHAEFIALEKKLSNVVLTGATVYTTLEPCTKRSLSKVPCAYRLAERKVARVVIGMLDPNKEISGRGVRQLRKSRITTELFKPDLMDEIEELNHEFIRAHEEPPRAEKAERDKSPSTMESSTKLPTYRPVVAPHGYGQQEYNSYGLFFGNDGYAAYDVSIPDVLIGSTMSKLTFDQKLTRLIDKDGKQFFEATIEHPDRPARDGGHLLREMVKARVHTVTVGIIYKDTDFRWYRSNCLIKREAGEVGLSVSFVGQEINLHRRHSFRDNGPTALSQGTYLASADL
jgi:pyrimidine deaminase RibD-like protein